MQKGKLEQLSKVEGMSQDEILESAVFDGDCYGICTNDGCEYTAFVEPDQKHGHCCECDTPTVVSCLILAGAM